MKNVIKLTVILLGELVLVSLTSGTTEAMTRPNCSCYTFHPTSLHWTDARKTCRKMGADLVSLETRREWQFILKQIQKRTTPKNEWHIGLTETRGIWWWQSGVELRPECEYAGCWPWQPSQPSGDEGRPHTAVMAKNWPPHTEGLFNDIRGTLGRGFICEQVKDHCKPNKDNCDAAWVKAIPTIKSTQPASTATIPSTTKPTTRLPLTTIRLSSTTPHNLNSTSWPKILSGVLQKQLSGSQAISGSNATTSSIRIRLAVTRSSWSHPTSSHVTNGDVDPSSFTEIPSQVAAMKSVQQSRVSSDQFQSITVVVVTIVGLLLFSIAALFIGSVLRKRRRKDRYRLTCWLHKHEPHGLSTVFILDKDQEVCGTDVIEYGEEQERIDLSSVSSSRLSWPYSKLFESGLPIS